MKSVWIYIGVVCLWSSVAPARVPVIDFHGHLDSSAAQRIRAIMDRSGVETVVNLSGGNFRFGVRGAARLAQQLNGRVVNFYTLDWRGRDAPWWGEREAARLEAAVKRFGFRGLKVSKALGLYIRDRNKVLIDVDDPRLDPIWERAGRLGIPVSIHTGDPKAFWLPPVPQNERYDELKVHPNWSFYNAPVPSREALLAARDRVVDRHPLTTFVCVHFGNNPEDLKYVEHLLLSFPNVWVDIAARVPEIGRHPFKRVRQFFIRFQDRILFGTDIAIGRRHLMLGSGGLDEPTNDDAARFYGSHWRFLETNDRQIAHPTPIQGHWKIDAIGLPTSVLTKIYRTNALKLLRRK